MSTRSTFTKHNRKHTSDTSNSNTTTNQVTLEELNDELEEAMTSSAATTQNEQPHHNTTTTNDHAEFVRQLIQRRNSTPHQDRQTRHQQNDHEIETHDQTTTKGDTNVANNLIKASKNTTSTKARRKQILIAHKQDRPAATTNTKGQGVADVFAHFGEELYTSTTKTLENEHEDNRDQPPTHDDTFHDAGTQQRHQPHQKNKAAKTKGVNADMIKHSTRRVKTTLSTIVQQSHQTKRRTATKPAGHGDQSHLQVETHHHHPITDPSVRSPCSINSSASSSSRRLQPSRLQTELLHGRTLIHVSTFKTESRRVATASLGCSH